MQLHVLLLYKCWIFCRFLSLFFNSSWTLLFYWKRARNQASAISAFPPPTSFSSLHMLNAYRLKGMSASWILWILIHLGPTWYILDQPEHTHTLSSCCSRPAVDMSSQQRDWEMILSQLPLSFIYCIYFLLFLSWVLCLHPRVYPGNYKYHIKLTTGLYVKGKRDHLFNPGCRIHFTICEVLCLRDTECNDPQ